MDLHFVPETAYDDYLKTGDERATALAQIQELKRHLQAAGTLSDHAASLLHNATNSLGRQQSGLDAFLACIPLAQRRPVGVQALIDKVFATAELLENILYFLGLHDALAAQKVNRAFFHAIEDSPRIQRNLGFLADDDSYLRVPLPLTTPSIYFFLDDLNDDFRSSNDDSVTLNGDIFNGVKRLPKLGSRCKRLLVCQPPIKQLSIYSDCCYDRFASLPPHNREPTHLIKNDNGVTLGDVIDNAKRIADEHSTCPSAPCHMHDEKGFVNPSLYLSARIILKEGDPRLKKKMQRRQEDAARSDRQRGINTRMPPYIAAKQAARIAGQPIPTLEEFEQRQAEEATQRVEAEQRQQQQGVFWSSS